MIGVMVEVTGLVIGGTSGAGDIHIVCFPCHAPASFASSSCILHGVPAAMHAFMSSSVQPGGSFISGIFNCAPVSFAASAPIAMDTTNARPQRVSGPTTNILFHLFMRTSESECE